MNGKIYKISNLVNGNIYIGQTTRTLAARFDQHKRDAKNGSTYVIHRAIRKHGIDNFIYEKIDGSGNYDKLLELEAHYIKEYDSYLHGYNMTLGGDGVFGHIFSKDSKKKMSESAMGHKRNLGFKHSEESKKKMREAQKGHKCSEEARAKMSEAHKGKQYALGCKHSEASNKIKAERMRGTKHGAKLTEIQVIDIKVHLKNKTKTTWQLANRYNVSYHCIYGIKVGRSWGYIKTINTK